MRSNAAQTQCGCATPQLPRTPQHLIREVANDLVRQRARKHWLRAASMQDKRGVDANESGTREHRRGWGGFEVARAHTERVRPARAGVAHEPARGAIIV